MKQPVIHIGYHKTATTWLQWHLWRRKDLGLYRVKYLPKFHGIHPLQFDAAAYRAAYREAFKEVPDDAIAVVSNERMSGHPHSGGFDSRDIADRLKAVFPNAKILIGIREQESAILSSYFQYVKKGGYCSLKGYLNPRADGHIPLFDLNHFRYDALIAHYQALFGEGNVKVTLFEAFKEQPMEYIAELAEFGGFKLGDKFPLVWKMNKSAPPLKVMLRSKLNVLIRRDTVNGNSPFATKIGAAVLLPVIEIFGRLSPSFLNKRKRRSWQSYLRQHVGDYFLASNLKTAQITGLPLSEHGYRIETEKN